MNTNKKSRIFTRFVAGPIAAAGNLGGVAMDWPRVPMQTPVRRITRAATRRTSATTRVIRTETSDPTSGTSGSGTTTGITRSGGTATADRSLSRID
jgi:hypothetical protein